jgi:hypothetical protein
MHPAVPDILDLAHVFGERFRDFDLDWKQIGVVIPGVEVRSILGMLEGGDRVNEVCRYGGLETTMDLTGKERRKVGGEACRLEASLVSVDCVLDDVLRFSIFLVDMKADKSGAILQDPQYRVPKERQDGEVRGQE